MLHRMVGTPRGWQRRVGSNAWSGHVAHAQRVQHATNLWATPCRTEVCAPPPPAASSLACLTLLSLTPHAQPLSAGEVVLKVPLRLALTDHPGDEDSNALMYEVRGCCGHAAAEERRWLLAQVLTQKNVVCVQMV